MPVSNATLSTVLNPANMTTIRERLEAQQEEMEVLMKKLQEDLAYLNHVGDLARAQAAVTRPLIDTMFQPFDADE
jgi:hypothetical protein